MSSFPHAKDSHLLYLLGIFMVLYDTSVDTIIYMFL